MVVEGKEEHGLVKTLDDDLDDDVIIVGLDVPALPSSAGLPFLTPRTYLIQ
jgi:hypothetical protein